MTNNANIKMIIAGIFAVYTVWFFYYHGRKFRKYSKAEFNEAARRLLKSALMWCLLFLALGTAWLWLNQLPITWDKSLKSGLIGLLFGIGTSIAADMRAEEKTKNE